MQQSMLHAIADDFAFDCEIQRAMMQPADAKFENDNRCSWDNGSAGWRWGGDILQAGGANLGKACPHMCAIFFRKLDA